MIEIIKDFIKKHKCKICICTYCNKKDSCSYLHYKCKYMCSDCPSIACDAKSVFGVTRTSGIAKII